MAGARATAGARAAARADSFLQRRAYPIWCVANLASTSGELLIVGMSTARDLQLVGPRREGIWRLVRPESALKGARYGVPIDPAHH